LHQLQPAPGQHRTKRAREYPTYREEYRCDERDRVVQTRQILTPTLSYVTKQAYDPAGNVVSMEDAKQRTQLRRYDALGRLSEEIGVDGGVTRYRYDVRDQVLEVTDAENNTHRFSYDKVGRKLTEARPMGQTIRYDYDPNGNVTLRESPNGAKRRYVYDAGRSQ
jgi:YD repeat-containing protein